MKCSKCWMREKGCLDVGHRDNHGACAADGIVNPDVACRAMRAVLKLARRLAGSGHHPDGVRPARVAERLARWATR